MRCSGGQSWQAGVVGEWGGAAHLAVGWAVCWAVHVLAGCLALAGSLWGCN